jgi:hypothetical protein
MVGGFLILALALNGRGMGRKIEPVSSSTNKRQIEHINATANLHRIADHRQEITRQSIVRFKRGLASRFGLDPTIPTERFFERLNQSSPDLFPAMLQRMLIQAEKKVPNESEFISVAATIADWSKRLNLP